MQILTNISKMLILVMLSCTLFLITWNSNLRPELMPVTPVIDDNVLSHGSIRDHLMNDTNHRSTFLPITDTNTAAHAASDSIWRSLRNGFILDHQIHSARVQAEIRELLADHDKLYRILTAAAPYIYFIHQQTQARGLPAEIALIPVIESEFNPYDHSKKGAAGLWQLMSGTAHELGIQIKSGYDGRRNIVASTKAALAYFCDLETLFKGNWYLAIAAYNCGQGKVLSAIRHANSHSFWDLKLSKETKTYVPKLLAVAAIIQNPEKYGIQLPDIVNKPYFEEVKVKKPVNLNQLAKSTGINITTLSQLNPDYKHNHQLVKKQVNTVLVPVNKASEVKAKLQV